MMTPVILPTQMTLPQLPSGGVCMLATINNQRRQRPHWPRAPTSIRSPPSRPRAFTPVVGRNGDSSWYQIDFGGGTGWVAGFVTRHDGDCSGVPMVNIPLQPTPQTPSAARCADRRRQRSVPTPRSSLRAAAMSRLLWSYQLPAGRPAGYHHLPLDATALAAPVRSTIRRPY